MVFFGAAGINTSSPTAIRTSSVQAIRSQIGVGRIDQDRFNAQLQSTAQFQSMLKSPFVQGLQTAFMAYTLASGFGGFDFFGGTSEISQAASPSALNLGIA